MAAIKVSSYLRIPRSKNREFWTASKIEHLRRLAITGKAARVWTPPEELCNRPLDRLRFNLAGCNPLAATDEVDTSVELARGRIIMTSPLYQGDMSFGALSGVANIALAKAADITGTLAGTGEGGLQSDVAKCRRITVQWASARFGVNSNTLSAGIGIVIKIGQGAKPGIGGHLPGTKVTEPISVTRRIPLGRDAISPAPHHDIYSIEDLGQRIWALKEATGKPVIVKVGATDYAPYIASGVARMGGDGIILDGQGAGTGAAPTVVKDNVGLPIEIAVASVDKMLRKENLRGGFSVIAAGRVSNAEDTAKLIALGADAVSIGTASLIAMGCVMVHKCHLGACPALLTNKIVPNPPRMLSLEQAVEWSVNLIRGWTEELELILKEIGIRRIRDLVGRRDLLRAHDMSDELMEILGVEPFDGQGGSSVVYKLYEGEFWTEKLKNHLKEIAGVIGRSPGEAQISSMGSTGPPFVEYPTMVSDWMVSDGAQVTRPSIDPYREEIETAVYIGRGRLRLSSPFFFAPLGEDLPLEMVRAFARVSCRMGILFDYGDSSPPEALSRYYERMLVKDGPSERLPESAVGVVIPHDDVGAIGDAKKRHNGKLIFVRLPASQDSPQLAVELAMSGADGVIIDGDMKCESDSSIEVATAEVDAALRNVLKDRLPLRNFVSLLVESEKVRGAGDIVKLVGLGADAVGFSRAALIAIDLDAMLHRRLDEDLACERLENLVVAFQKEVKLLAGAAGISRVYTSLVGNREIFRAVDMEPDLRERLGLKPAGVG